MPCRRARCIKERKKERSSYYRVSPRRSSRCRHIKSPAGKQQYASLSLPLFSWPGHQGTKDGTGPRHKKKKAPSAPALCTINIGVSLVRVPLSLSRENFLRLFCFCRFPKSTALRNIHQRASPLTLAARNGTHAYLVRVLLRALLPLLMAFWHVKVLQLLGANESSAVCPMTRKIYVWAAQCNLARQGETIVSIQWLWLLKRDVVSHRPAISHSTRRTVEPRYLVSETTSKDAATLANVQATCT